MSPFPSLLTDHRRWPLIRLHEAQPPSFGVDAVGRDSSEAPRSRPPRLFLRWTTCPVAVKHSRAAYSARHTVAPQCRSDPAPCNLKASLTPFDWLRKEPTGNVCPGARTVCSAARIAPGHRHALPRSSRESRKPRHGSILAIPDCASKHSPLPARATMTVFEQHGKRKNLRHLVVPATFMEKFTVVFT